MNLAGEGWHREKRGTGGFSRNAIKLRNLTALESKSSDLGTSLESKSEDLNSSAVHTPTEAEKIS